MGNGHINIHSTCANYSVYWTSDIDISLIQHTYKNSLPMGVMFIYETDVLQCHSVAHRTIHVVVHEEAVQLSRPCDVLYKLSSVVHSLYTLYI